MHAFRKFFKTTFCRVKCWSKPPGLTSVICTIKTASTRLKSSSIHVNTALLHRGNCANDIATTHVQTVLGMDTCSNEQWNRITCSCKTTLSSNSMALSTYETWYSIVRKKTLQSCVQLRQPLSQPRMRPTCTDLPKCNNWWNDQVKPTVPCKTGHVMGSPPAIDSSVRSNAVPRSMVLLQE